MSDLAKGAHALDASGQEYETVGDYHIFNSRFPLGGLCEVDERRTAQFFEGVGFLRGIQQLKLAQEAQELWDLYEWVCRKWEAWAPDAEAAYRAENPIDPEAASRAENPIDPDYPFFFTELESMSQESDNAANFLRTSTLGDHNTAWRREIPPDLIKFRQEFQSNLRELRIKLIQLDKSLDC